MDPLDEYKKQKTVPMVTTSVSIEETQMEFVKSQGLNLSAITRKAIEAIRKRVKDETK